VIVDVELNGIFWKLIKINLFWWLIFDYCDVSNLKPGSHDLCIWWTFAIRGYSSCSGNGIFVRIFGIRHSSCSRRLSVKVTRVKENNCITIDIWYWYFPTT
jgi:hypothetical protein